VKLRHLLEIGLRQGTIPGVAAPGDGEQRMHPAVRRFGEGSAGSDDEGEASLTNRAVRSNKEWDSVRGATGRSRLDLRIGADVGILVSPRTGTARRRLRMATRATVGVECRAQTVCYLVRFVEADQTVREVL
jgi:hypothetical protein